MFDLNKNNNDVEDWLEIESQQMSEQSFSQQQNLGLNIRVVKWALIFEERATMMLIFPAGAFPLLVAVKCQLLIRLTFPALTHQPQLFHFV